MNEEKEKIMIGFDIVSDVSILNYALIRLHMDMLSHYLMEKVGINCEFVYLEEGN